MTKPSVDLAPPQPSLTQWTTGRWLYPFLFTIQTIGALLFYVKGLPFYRQVVDDPSSYSTWERSWVWLLGASALMQVGYWARYRLRPPVPQFVNVFLGHVMVFLSRLGFMLPTLIFSFVFISRRLDAQMSVGRYAVLVLGLFSLFCYTQELQSLGNAFMEQRKNPEVSTR